MPGLRRQAGSAENGYIPVFLSMNEAKLRVILRWTHIILGLVIMCYIYSPWTTKISFQIFIKFVVVPAIAITGVWIWKFPMFNRLFARKR